MYKVYNLTSTNEKITYNVICHNRITYQNIITEISIMIMILYA